MPKPQKLEYGNPMPGSKAIQYAGRTLIAILVVLLVAVAIAMLYAVRIGAKFSD